MHDLVPMDRTIVGRPEQLANALQRAADQGRLIGKLNEPVKRPDGTYAVRVRMMTPVEKKTAPEKRATTARRQPSVFAEIFKALAWVGMVGVSALGLIVGVVLMVASMVSVTTLVGLGVVLLAVGLLLVNRSSHSGACPGVVVHCKGCKH